MKDIPLKERIYALYQGEDNLMDGTLDEICARRGIKFATAKMMVSNAYAKRLANRKRNKNRIEFVRIDNVTEEDWDNVELAVPATTEDISVSESQD